MTQEICPICGKNVSNLLQHLVLEHNIKDQDHLKSVISSLPEPRTQQYPEKTNEPYTINWDTELYRIVTQLSSEKRILYIEKKLDELLDIVDRVENEQLLELMRMTLSNLHSYNDKIINQIKDIINKAKK